MSSIFNTINYSIFPCKLIQCHRFHNLPDIITFHFSKVENQIKNKSNVCISFHKYFQLLNLLKSLCLSISTTFEKCFTDCTVHMIGWLENNVSRLLGRLKMSSPIFQVLNKNGFLLSNRNYRLIALMSEVRRILLYIINKAHQLATVSSGRPNWIYLWQRSKRENLKNVSPRRFLVARKSVLQSCDGILYIFGIEQVEGSRESIYVVIIKNCSLEITFVRS